MTPKERMLRAARGEWADILPWVPRIDLWYNANSLQGTLPAKYRRGVTLDEIADDIGGGYHKIVPDFLNARSPEDTVDRGLGIFRLKGMPYRAELAGVEREVKKEGNATFVTYHTPLGSISCKILYTEEMRRAGVSITWISEHVIKDPQDYKIVGYIFKNIKVIPDYENYLEFQRQVGDKGFAAARGLAAASPMQQIMRDFLDATQFYLEMYDHPQEMRQLCEDLEPYYDQLFQVLANSPAEVVFHGSNFDEMITYPPFFRNYIMPYLQRLADMLHARGKLLICHCDGENQGLLDLIAESGMDIAEAICPQPMTKVTISEVKKSFKGKVTIFGGVPSVALLDQSMSDEEFERFMKNLFQEIVPGDRFILGISDTTPPDAKFERLFRITEMVQGWGKLPMKMPK
ncbi:MAG: uroporphyrinogen decarboxylase family protein [Deltaproteobacteria bacterium]|nr:uroporphyrinogen decarboxylase family protein [Deltaproteobacteria bacterium]